MVISVIFTLDIPVGPSKRTIAFLGLYSDKAMFLVWRYLSVSSYEVYLWFQCLKEMWIGPTLSHLL